jgi:hypothetical protein
MFKATAADLTQHIDARLMLGSAFVAGAFGALQLPPVL